VRISKLPVLLAIDYDHWVYEQDTQHHRDIMIFGQRVFT
jgi:hypothetical protein